VVAFDKHPYPRLVRAFKGYQGQDPSVARYIFVGLDANFSSSIEESPIKDEILDYLSDGVEYWKKTQRHHPFLSPYYEKGSGYKYHLQFAKMGLTPDYADKISFVELLGCPTRGKASYKRFMELLEMETEHLRRLDLLISSSQRKKIIFIARGAYPILFKVGKKFDCFKWLSEPRKFNLNQLYAMSTNDKLKVYVITHFSDSISDEHIATIKDIIEADQ